MQETAQAMQVKRVRSARPSGMRGSLIPPRCCAVLCRVSGKTWLVIGTSVNMKGRAHTTYNVRTRGHAQLQRLALNRPALIVACRFHSAPHALRTDRPQGCQQQQQDQCQSKTGGQN